MHAGVPWMPEVQLMAMITVRNLDPVVHAKLRERAARHGRSMEAEARAVLTDAVMQASESMDLVTAARKVFGDKPPGYADFEIPPRTDYPREIAFD